MSRARPWLAAACSYLAITLGVPWLNGASANPRFAAHALWVIGLVFSMGGALLFFAAARMIVRRVP
jgi:hypothetical protein